MQERSSKISVDSRWFDENREYYLSLPDFQSFQEISGVDFRDLLSQNPEKLKRAQEELEKKCKFVDAIRTSHAGPWLPLFYYTGDTRFWKGKPEHIQELDNMWLRFDMGDSLRRRNIGLSHIILPEIIRRIYNEKKEPIKIANFGSGMGLDTTHSAAHTNGLVKSVTNYDYDTEAIKFGKKVVQHLEEKGELDKGVVEFKEMNMENARDRIDLGVLVGVICSMKNEYAERLIGKIYRRNLDLGGYLVVSSSNINMRSQDPLPNFLLQHIGLKEDPTKSWGLNFRAQERMKHHFQNSNHRFSEVEIYHDADYPGRDELPERLLYGVDSLPLEVEEYPRTMEKSPMPAKEVLEKQIGYNWLTIARK